MKTFGGTSRSKVVQVPSGDSRQAMVDGLYSRESATREFADLDVPRPPSHISPGAHSVYNDDEWATEHPSKYQ